MRETKTLLKKKKEGHRIIPVPKESAVANSVAYWAVKLDLRHLFMGNEKIKKHTKHFTLSRD